MENNRLNVEKIGKKLNNPNSIVSKCSLSGLNSDEATIPAQQNEKISEIKGQNKRTKFGTLEWAEWNINCVSGCKNSCTYCYAQSMAIRFKRKTPETWKNEVIDSNKVEKNYRKRNGVGMYPSSHDITPATVNASLVVLKKLLSAGNQMLVVSKPNYQVIVRLCDELKEFKEQLVFRFTIGSASSDTLKFWEPGAPSFEERILALKHAYQSGFATSISLEPALDLFPEKVVEKVYDLVTKDIWIGLPNMLNARLIMNGYANDKKIIVAATELQKGQSIEWINRLVERYHADDKIRWKDSINAIINGN